MPIDIPSLEQLASISRWHNLDLSDEDLREMQQLMRDGLASLNRVEALEEPKNPVVDNRDRGRAPTPEENRYNQWAWRCRIGSSASGLLAGKTVGVKDNICVAGVPMVNGSALMEGFVPDIDATVVTRILEAGGEIVGKTTCDNLCFSATGQTPITGPVKNPYDPERLSGGSSAGSAVALVAGDCDLALGGDQGGSIRLPACWSGCVGHKPTYGLVPYTGCFPLEMSFDHVGPMARSVGDVATLLDVIAGPDDKDFRQGPMPAGAAYKEQLSLRLDDLRIGIVQEGFGWEGKSEPEVDESVREAARRFTDLGAVVRDVSIPLHRDGVHIWNVIGIEGTLTTMIQGDCAGRGWKGEYPTELVAFFGEMRRKKGRDLPPMVRYVTLFGQFLSDTYGGRYYAKAQNLARALKATYDAALTETDILVMPTTPMRAIRYISNQRLAEYAKTTQINIDNAAPFDATGHPSLSVPVAVVGGLPIGMMLAGRSWEDGTVLRAGYAFQQRFAPDFIKPITV